MSRVSYEGEGMETKSSVVVAEGLVNQRNFGAAPRQALPGSV